HLAPLASLADQAPLELGARVFAACEQPDCLIAKRNPRQVMPLPSRAPLRFRGSGAAYAGRRDADSRAYLGFDLRGELGMLAQIFAGVVLALADLLAAIRVPSTGFLDDVVHHAELNDLALARDPLAIENVEQRLAERRRDLVLDDLDAGLVTDDFFAALDRADAADVEPHRSVELERVAAGRGLGIAEHH